MWISQRLRVHLPNQGHVTTATYIRARYMTPKHIRNDHAKAFIHVAIIVSSRRSLGGQGYFMLLFFFLKKPCSGSHCNGPVSICCARNSAHVVHMLDIIAFYTCALVDMQLFHLPKTLQKQINFLYKHYKGWCHDNFSTPIHKLLCAVRWCGVSCIIRSTSCDSMLQTGS